jgi:hypothetical protein
MAARAPSQEAQKVMTITCHATLPDQSSMWSRDPLMSIYRHPNLIAGLPMQEPIHTAATTTLNHHQWSTGPHGSPQGGRASTIVGVRAATGAPVRP